MEETFNTEAIILSRCDFRENDSRIVCYSEDFGKMELIARGAKKISSKSSGHIEPITLSRLMIVRGKELNYAGTAIGKNFFTNIKDDLEKIKLALKATCLVERMTRENETDSNKKIFHLLKFFLENLENMAGDYLAQDIFFKNFSQELKVISGFSSVDFEDLGGNFVK